MKLCVISFTENGERLSEQIAEKLKQASEIETELFTKCRRLAEGGGGGLCDPSVRSVEESVGEWAGKQMRRKCVVLFIGACGIAVRAVAPYLTDKLHDGPVLVMDESGRYVIPLVAGHVGGANELACYLAGMTGAEPVITTATDINGKFAADLFARKNGLTIVNREGIAKVSAKVLAGETVTVSVEPGYEEELVWTWENGGLSGADREGGKPDRIPYPPDRAVDILITAKKNVYDAALVLCPREYVIGFGCRRGKQAEEIGSFIAGKLQELDISMAQILALASVSRKRDEKGILAWCRKEGIPFLTYTAEELRETEGEFASSPFVEEQMGVDNVCERSAVRACGPGGRLIAGKYAADGMTIAVAKKSRRQTADMEVQV